MQWLFKRTQNHFDVITAIIITSLWVQSGSYWYLAAYIPAAIISVLMEEFYA